jgi:hypothetical protein
MLSGLVNPFYLIQFMARLLLFPAYRFMKITTVLTLAVATIIALLAGEDTVAAAGLPSGLVVNMSFSANVYKTNYVKTPYTVASTAVLKFDEKNAYSLVSNIIANAYIYSSCLPRTNLPANGYIAYNSSASDGGFEKGMGFFYVTNTSGFYLPLSGYDHCDNYYSYLELDGNAPEYTNEDSILGFGDTLGNEFESVGTYSLNYTTGTGPATGTGMVILYLHDNPYQFDAVDHPENISLNVFAVEIYGSIKFGVTYKNNQPGNMSGTLIGAGNLFRNFENGNGVITSGMVKLQ